MHALIAWGPAVTWATILFLLSEVSTFTPVVWLATHDKLVHIGLYGTLGGTLAWGQRLSKGTRPHWAIVGLGVLYGGIDELHQYFVPNRMPSLGDFAADIIGVLIGYGTVLILWAVATRSRTS